MYWDIVECCSLGTAYEENCSRELYLCGCDVLFVYVSPSETPRTNNGNGTLLQAWNKAFERTRALRSCLWMEFEPVSRLTMEPTLARIPLYGLLHLAAPSVLPRRSVAAAFCLREMLHISFYQLAARV